MTRRPLLLLLLSAASGASLFAVLLAGTFPISARQVVDSVLYPVPGVVHDVIWRQRAPLACAVFACGALLGCLGLAAARVLRGSGIAGCGRLLPVAALLGGSALTAAYAVSRWTGASWQPVL